MRAILASEAFAMGRHNGRGEACSLVRVHGPRRCRADRAPEYAPPLEKRRRLGRHGLDSQLVERALLVAGRKGLRDGHFTLRRRWLRC